MASTLLGAVIGIAATLLTDQVKWRREAKREEATALRLFYGDYLAAAANALDGMRLAAQEAGEDGSVRQARVREAFRDAELYAMRFKMSMLAPPNVVSSAIEVLRHARAIRDLLVAGHGVQSEEFRSANDSFFSAIDQATEAMRENLKMTQPRSHAASPEAIVLGGPLAQCRRSSGLTHRG
ncbi:hypothetical protein ACWIF8_01595 [Micromonospora chalcea]